MPVKSNREYRNMAMSAIEQNDSEQEQDNRLIVRGYASTFNEPYTLFRSDDYQVNEVVDANAFANTDMSDVIMQYDHVGRVFARISNGTLDVSTDDKGLLIDAELGGTELGRQLYEEIRGGYTNKMSFGFRVGKDKREETEERDEDNGTTTVTILQTILTVSKLYDVSAVSIPANDGTSISSRNFAEGVIDEVRKEIAKREERERQKKKIRIMTEVL